ncbi:MAG: T9SS type A sorting domain-containing protein [Bacteroidetes bacterium]|nr:T9SS type A sorting domain-containing protein [Bacteroidota bacterium]
MVNWIINTNGSRIVPFGYDAASYIPLTFQQTSGAAGTVSFATYRTAADNTPFPATVTHVRDVSGADNSSNTVDRFWHITTTGAANANLTFSYVSSEGTGILAPRAQLWEPVSTGWFPPVAGQSNPTGSSTLAGPIAAFNTWWTLAAGSSPLPIELVSFEVKKAGSTAAIMWQTASEINNDYFTVERSDDGVNFELLLKVDGAGNSTSVRSYSAIDQSPLKGINYYRLKQTDFDGKFTYSEIKSIYFGKGQTFSVYPNPVASNSDFTISVPDKAEYSISIIELTGKIIYSEKNSAGDKNEIIVRVNNLAISAGIYQLVVRSANEQYNQKLIIRK